MTSWSTSQIPDQAGRTIVVTGANSGLGESTARVLAHHGARVIIASRNEEKARHAAERMTGDVSIARLDLADLESVRSFADATGEIDVLVNNAGVMAVPEGRTAQGFERQIGTNFLGPFALTGLLLPKIRERVVTLSSTAHRAGRIELGDLNWHRRRYSAWPAYGQSKLADLMFSFELDRRLRATGSSVISVAAHPGLARTELGTHGSSLQSRVISFLGDRIGQSGDDGAFPQLYAATMPDVRGGDFFGPDGRGEIRGGPTRVGSNRASRDAEVASVLWDRAEKLTGVSFL